MRTRILVALVLLTLLLAPAAARAGEVSRTPAPRALSTAWSLTELWADVISHIANMWSTGLTQVPPPPSAPAGGGATTDASGCIDPNGQPHCGS